MEIEKNIFEGKTVSDLLKEVYDKKIETDSIVRDKITVLSSFISTPGDAIVVVPLIKDLLDAGLKNDDIMMKMIQLFKQPVQSNKPGDKESEGILSDKDIQQLFNEVNTAKSDVKSLTN
jgi:hypothetical protein